MRFQERELTFKPESGSATERDRWVAALQGLIDRSREGREASAAAAAAAAADPRPGSASYLEKLKKVRGGRLRRRRTRACIPPPPVPRVGTSCIVWSLSDASNAPHLADLTGNPRTSPTTPQQDVCDSLVSSAGASRCSSPRIRVFVSTDGSVGPDGAGQDGGSTDGSAAAAARPPSPRSMLANASLGSAFVTQLSRRGNSADAAGAEAAGSLGGSPRGGAGSQSLARPGSGCGNQSLARPGSGRGSVEGAAAPSQPRPASGQRHRLEVAAGLALQVPSQEAGGEEDDDGIETDDGGDGDEDEEVPIGGAFAHVRSPRGADSRPSSARPSIDVGSAGRLPPRGILKGGSVTNSLRSSIDYSGRLAPALLQREASGGGEGGGNSGSGAASPSSGRRLQGDSGGGGGGSQRRRSLTRVKTPGVLLVERPQGGSPGPSTPLTQSGAGASPPSQQRQLDPPAAEDSDALLSPRGVGITAQRRRSLTRVKTPSVLQLGGAGAAEAAALAFAADDDDEILKLDPAEFTKLLNGATPAAAAVPAVAVAAAATAASPRSPWQQQGAKQHAAVSGVAYDWDADAIEAELEALSSSLQPRPRA